MADRTRIAVVLIHGMGEPRPMATIRSFVDAIANRDTPPIKSWSKPLDEALLYDIRRIVMEGNRSPRPTVDFYEFYWAHLMQGNKYVHLTRWLMGIVFRSPARVPKHLMSIYLVGWVLLALVALSIALLLLALFLGGGWSFWWPLISAGATLVLGICSYFLLGTLADAARYLDTLPDNVQARFEIQKAGVATIQNLLGGDFYHRVVVVGHSLGAMIGYDMLRHAWLQFAKKFEPQHERKLAAIRDLSDAVRDWKDKPQTVEAYKALQENAWAEHIGNGGDWRVTDFITLGAPLAHAELLMASDPADFARRTTGRELSTCPPTWDPKFGITQKVPVKSLGPEKKPTVQTPDHAGVFALTRWTNLFSPPAFLFFGGDFLSGKLAPVFGPGIEDVQVKAGHTSYWTQGLGPTLTTLVEAMDLTGRNPAYAPAAGEETTPDE